MGAMNFNELPLAARLSDNVLNFRKIMKIFMRNISPLSSYFPRRDCTLVVTFYSLLFSVFHFYRTNVNSRRQTLIADKRY